MVLGAAVAMLARALRRSRLLFWPFLDSVVEARWPRFVEERVKELYLKIKESTQAVVSDLINFGKYDRTRL